MQRAFGRGEDALHVQPHDVDARQCVVDG
jgi:hypothetical protein